MKTIITGQSNLADFAALRHEQTTKCLSTLARSVPVKPGSDTEHYYASTKSTTNDLSEIVDSVFMEFDSMGSDLYGFSKDDDRIVATKNKSFDDISESRVKFDRTLSPLSILLVRQIQDRKYNRSLRVLFDSGSDASHVQQRCLPSGI